MVPLTLIANLKYFLCYNYNVNFRVSINFQRVNLLAMETRRLVKCNHSRKTAAFVRACAAYTFITIPSVSNVISRLKLFVLSGRVAVANGALSQGKKGVELDKKGVELLIICCSWLTGYHYYFLCLLIFDR